MTDRAQFDQNNNTALIAVSNDGQRTPVELWADPTTHALVTSSGGGGGGGTSSTFNAAFPATGTAIGASDGSNMVPLKVDGSGNLETTIASTTSLTPGTLAANLGKAEDAAHASGDTGVFSLAVRNDGANTSFSGTNGDYTPFSTDAQGRQYVVQKATAATLTNVGGSASSVTLLSANDARMGAQITNDSSAVIYIKLGATASTTSYTVSLAGAASAPFSYYEIPSGYTGRVDAIWASATGNARVTEIT